MSIGATPTRRRRGPGVSRLVAIGAVTFLVAGLTIVGTQISASAAGVTGTITVTPSTGLSNGQSVTITGSGFTASSIGNILECNTDPKQPNVMDGGLVNSAISVSCNAPSLQAVVTTTASGGVSTTFKVVQGTVGPPCGPAPAVVTCPATDLAGNSPTADAALYPCPPTPAQQAIGDVCTLTFGDQANDSGVATILFGAETPPGATTTTAATTATTKPATTATTTAPATGAGSGTTAPVSATPAAGTLATTGPGRGVGLLGAVGGVLLLFGLVLLLVLLHVPQRAFAGVFDRDATRSASTTVDRGSGGTLVTARALAHRVGSASVRTAAWFLGR